MDEKILSMLLETMIPMDNAQPYFRGLLYGESGTGKTLQATGVGNKILYIESDPEGWVTLMDYPEHKAKCTRMVYQGLSQLDAVSQAIEEGLPEFAMYDCIVLDTLSHIAVADLDVVLKVRSGKDAEKDPNVATLPDMGATTERVRRSLTRMLKLPIHVVMTSHVREDTDNRTGLVSTRPSFMPKMRKDVERMCHLIGYMTAISQGEEYVRRMQVHPTRSIAAKSRIGGLSVVQDIDNPDAVANIVNEWLASGAVEKEPESVKEDSQGLAPTSTDTNKSESSDELVPTGLEL